MARRVPRRLCRPHQLHTQKLPRGEIAPLRRRASGWTVGWRHTIADIVARYSFFGTERAVLSLRAVVAGIVTLARIGAARWALSTLLVEALATRIAIRLRTWMAILMNPRLISRICRIATRAALTTASGEAAAWAGFVAGRARCAGCWKIAPRW